MRFTAWSWRRWLSAIGVLLLSLLASAFAVLLWLLYTEAGRDVALGRLVAALPENVQVRYAHISGILAGTLRLQDLEVITPAADIQARRLQMNIILPVLLWRELRLDHTDIEGLSVTLPIDKRSATQASSSRFSLPRLRLPLSITVNGLQLQQAAIYRGEETLLTRSGGQWETLAINKAGRIEVKELVLRGPFGEIAANGWLRLDEAVAGEGELSFIGATAAQPRAELSLTRAKNRQYVALELPENEQLAVSLQYGSGPWQLQSRLRDFDPAPWWPEWRHGTITAILDATGTGRRATLQGQVGVNGNLLAIKPSSIEASAGFARLQLDPLILTPSSGGAVTLRGELALAPEGSSTLSVVLNEIALPAQPSATVSGHLQVNGSWKDYEFTFTGNSNRGTEQASLQLEGAGNSAALRLTTLDFAAGAGELGGSASIQWQPEFGFSSLLTLKRLDPSWFAEDFPGALSGSIQADGGWRNQRLALNLYIDSLQGNLRNRPVQGRGRIVLGAGAAAEPTDLAVRIGASHVRVMGQGTEPLDLTLALQPLHLKDLMPDVQGQTAGSLHLSGAYAQPRLTVALNGSDFVWNEMQIGHMALAGEVPFAVAEQGQLALRILDAHISGQAIPQAHVTAAGSREDHTLEGNITATAGNLDFSLQGSVADDGWQGTLRQLALQPTRFEPARLQSPAAMALSANGIQLQPACLQGAFRLCASAETRSGTQTIALDLEAMPLATLTPLVPGPQGSPVAIEGTTRGHATLAFGRAGMALELELQSPTGQLAWLPLEQRHLLAWQDLRLHVSLDNQWIDASAAGIMEQTGTLDLRLQGASPIGNRLAPISGRLQLDLPHAPLLELLAPDLLITHGELHADVALGGNWSAPQVTGSARLDALRGEIPRLGVALQDARVSLISQGGETTAIEALIATEQGALAAHGQIEWRGGSPAIAFHAEGERVLIADIPLAHVIASPTLEGRFADGLLTLSGRVEIPEATVDLGERQARVRTSPDVVIIDAAESASAGPPLQLDTTVEIVLGDAVTFIGSGLNGHVTGTVTVREQPGREAIGRGVLQLTGAYKGYGQELEITRGRLSFTGSALDNPIVNIRAERRYTDQKVGLEISGTAQQPILRIFSEPPLEQAEGLSYLVFGRPLRTASEADSAQLTQAAASIGGNLLASQIGARLGLDTLGISKSPAAGGNRAFTAGKYLSAKLYVSYGVSLLGQGQVITFRYLLGRYWEARIEAGLENRAGLNYRLEK